MIRLAVASAVLTLGLASMAVAAAPGALPAPPTAAAQAQPVVDIYIGSGYYGRRYHPRYHGYPWYRPWYRPYAYDPFFYAPAPVVVVTQPPPQPVWTGAGVIWMFPGGAPQ